MKTCCSILAALCVLTAGCSKTQEGGGSTTTASTPATPPDASASTGFAPVVKVVPLPGMPETSAIVPPAGTGGAAAVQVTTPVPAAPASPAPATPSGTFERLTLSQSPATRAKARTQAMAEMLRARQQAAAAGTKAAH